MDDAFFEFDESVDMSRSKRGMLSYSKRQLNILLSWSVLMLVPMAKLHKLIRRCASDGEMESTEAAPQFSQFLFVRATYV